MEPDLENWRTEIANEREKESEALELYIEALLQAQREKDAEIIRSLGCYKCGQDCSNPIVEEALEKASEAILSNK